MQTKESTSSTDIERELAAAIDPWLAHMTWRADFAAWREKRLHLEDYQQPYLQDIEAHAAAQLSGTVLDVGAGMGGLVVALARQGVQVVAQEYNPAYCQIIGLRARRYALDLPVVNSAGEALPFADASFQLITAWDVLEHVQDVPATLRELRRILAPQGRAIVTITNRFGFRDPHYHLAAVNWLPRPIAEWYIARKGRSKQGNFQDRQRLSEMHYYTYAAFTREVQRAGFRALDVAEARVLQTKPRPRSQGKATEPPPRSLGRVGEGSMPRRVLPILRHLGLARPLYHAYRCFFQGTHTILLRRSEE
jgi:2-polyprenyl-3-methyl-5-hydroxy-6-metoxy-1,4-benzoquinol methylase